MKIRSIATLLSVIILGAALCACGSSEGKSAYRPPAEIFGVTISGTSEPQIDGVRFTYDSKARIDTVTFTCDGYEYKQQYSYDDPAQIVIKTIYQTEVVEEKVIRYVDIPVESGFTTVDGYYIRVTDDMASGNNSINDSTNKRILSEYINISRSDLVSEFGNSYTNVDMPGTGLTDCIMFDTLSDVVFGISAETNNVIVIFCSNPDLDLVKGLSCDMTISELKSLDSNGFTADEYDLEIDGTHNYRLQYNDGFIVCFTWNGNYSGTLADFAVIQNKNYLR